MSIDPLLSAGHNSKFRFDVNDCHFKIKKLNLPIRPEMSEHFLQSTGSRDRQNFKIRFYVNFYQRSMSCLQTETLLKMRRDKNRWPQGYSPNKRSNMVMWGIILLLRRMQLRLSRRFSNFNPRAEKSTPFGSSGVVNPSTSRVDFSGWGLKLENHLDDLGCSILRNRMILHMTILPN